MTFPLLIESIRLENGKLANLSYHTTRMNAARTTYKLNDQPFNLDSFFQYITLPQEGLWKCRILYDSSIKQIHYKKYQPKDIRSLKLVRHDTIVYDHKLADRTQLDTLYRMREKCDDIIISKHGMVTDSYYGNLLFLQKGTWYTPNTNLLQGTQRQFLLDQKLIEEKIIRENDIMLYEKVKIINAMIDLASGPEIAIENIIM